MRHAGRGARRIVCILNCADGHPIILEELHGSRRRGHLMTAKLLVGIDRASFVDSADLDVGTKEGDGSADHLRGAVGTVGVGGRGLAVGPLKRQQRGQIARVVVVQVREEYGVQPQVRDMCGNQLPQCTVSTINQIRPAVDHYRAG